MNKPVDYMDHMPKWQRELSSFLGVKSTFIIEGNVHENYYPLFRQNEAGLCEAIEFADDLNDTIVKLFEMWETKGTYEFLFCDPIFGFSDNLGFEYTPDLIKRFAGIAKDEDDQINRINHIDRRAQANAEIVRTSKLIRAAITQGAEDTEEKPGRATAVIMNMAPHYLTSPDRLDADETAFFLNLLYASNNAKRVNIYSNTLILCVNKLNDVPAWFYLNNPNVRTISIPMPDRTVRQAFVEQFFSPFINDQSPETQGVKKKFVDLTDGMRLLEIDELRRLHKKKDMPIAEIPDLVSFYKYGFKDNQWERIRDKIEDDVKARIEETVKGQGDAVDRVVLILKRAVAGLSGMQHSSDSSKPRGVVFLAGPTGTGKTELVKTITRLLFEDERSLVRFDMSEYRAEQSDQKLFGAPPGYVGYDSGGQLTNAVKNNPFSILLFDEIEKAHPSIMDKFLQILEDGRMTDGQGQTVHFSETLIFFTSNIGISRWIKNRETGLDELEPLVDPRKAKLDDIKRAVNEAMPLNFKQEFLNRLGENIVVFDFITEENSKKIVDLIINERINQNLKSKKAIEIDVTPEAFEKTYSLCFEDKPRQYGGRGIGNVIEERYLNPLAEHIFDKSCGEGDRIVVDVADDELVFAVL